MPAFISKYKIIEKIGEGSFSEVIKCEERTSKEQFAAKILKKFFSTTNDVLYCAEIIAMQKLSKHPNVLYMHDYFFEKSSGKLILIFELMDMSMYEFMKTRKRCIPEGRVKNYLYQILKGLDYLHRHGLFHRDIKPENILVKLPNNATSPQGEIIKLADLGSIRGIYSKPPYTEYISTRWYRSPECLLTVGHYGPKMDIWATGCVFYEILTMKPLFPGNNEIDQLARIHAILGTPSSRLLAKLKSRSKNLLSKFNKSIGSGLGPLIKNFSEDAQTILKLMLQYDPEIRSNARRLLQHRYFAVFSDEEKNRKYLSRSYLGRGHGDNNIQDNHPQMSGSYARRNIPGQPPFMSRTSVELGNNCSYGAPHESRANLKTYSEKHLNKVWQQNQRNKIASAYRNGLLRNTTSNLNKIVWEAEEDCGDEKNGHLQQLQGPLMKRNLNLPKTLPIPDFNRIKI